MNKTALVLGYFGLVLVCIIMVCLVTLFAPGTLDTVIQFVATILGVASTGAVTFYMLGKQNETVNQIKAQTNGTLTALHEKNEALTNQLLALVSAAPTADSGEPTSEQLPAPAQRILERTITSR